MGTPHHQQSLHRKLIYIGLILAIFFALIFYRPLVIENKAQALSLRDEDRGDVELTGKVVELGLSGMRGVMVTMLWSGAKDKMEKNQWNELELLVRSVTKLQPHFITPWIFQSWNLSYNVAVQCDREADQYFYITRGIELLAEGERQNRYNPEMRHEIGNYTAHKIMLADRTSMLAALHHMSCIDPVQRDPRRFRKPNTEGRVTLDLVEFEKFCQEHPQLVRRLREKVHCSTPEDVVQFLDENQRVPSLYEDDPERMKRRWVGDEQTKLRAPGDRFPVLPPPSGPERERQDRNALTQDSPLEDHIDAYLVARAWYSYAVEALPDPSWIPGRFQLPDPKKHQKVPRYTTLLFRNSPARAQSYAAQRLEEDGWYDNRGWLITGWFPRDQFPNDPVVGTERKWTQEAWGEAHRLWEEIGKNHHLLISAEDERNFKTKAEAFVKENQIPAGVPPPDVAEEDLTDEGMRAYIFLWHWEYYRRLSNFAHFLAQARIFALPQTVEARRHFYLAEKAMTDGDRRQAIDEFEKALPLYDEILKESAEFRRDGTIAEEALDFQYAYLNLCWELQGRPWKQAQAIQAFLGLAVSGPSPVPDALPLAQIARPHLLPDGKMHGPLDHTFDPDQLADFDRLKNPSKGPPPGMDMRQMMMERGMSMGQMQQGMRPGMQPGGIQMPKNVQAPPGGQMPPGMRPQGGRPGGLPPGKQ